MIKRAIISVSDKEGIVEFAKALHDLDVQIISTGGTAKKLSEHGLSCIEVSSVTGFPECLDGRVKTLDPKIFGGILADRSKPGHMQQIKDLGVEPIDLVVVNLYPFKKTVLKPDVDMRECIENIDIGGPSMLRAAAKNYQSITVVTDPNDYDKVITQIKSSGDTTLETRMDLARKVFEHTASYDAMIASYLRDQTPGTPLPESYTLTFEKISSLRYGENPHQTASFYQNAFPVKGSLCQARQLNGKELSYNNIADTDAAICCLKEFSKPAVVAVKHANPCGVGSADTIFDAWQKAYEADSVSIFGGIVALNRAVDLQTAQKMKEIFLEVIIAPSYADDALLSLSEKKNLRVLELKDISEPMTPDELNYKRIVGGLLVQDYDRSVYDETKLRVVTKKKPDETLMADLIFALKVVKHAKSNAIVVASNMMTQGIGPGQTNRIGAAGIALDFAGEKAKGAVMASDAFFPFSDCVTRAAKAGIAAIIQPGGSVRDQESIDACDKLGLAMIFTGERHFCH